MSAGILEFGFTPTNPLPNWLPSPIRMSHVDYLHDGHLHHQTGGLVEEHVIEGAQKTQIGARRITAAVIMSRDM